MNPERLSQHAYELARAFNVLLLLDADCPRDCAAAGKIDGRPVIIARRIDDETSYIIVLHELGHHCSPWGFLRRDTKNPSRNLMFEEECAAWTWARHYALDWTPAMEAVERYALGTYGQKAE